MKTRDNNPMHPSGEVGRVLKWTDYWFAARVIAGVIRHD